MCAARHASMCRDFLGTGNQTLTEGVSGKPLGNCSISRPSLWQNLQEFLRLQFQTWVTQLILLERNCDQKESTEQAIPCKVLFLPPRLQVPVLVMWFSFFSSCAREQSLLSQTETMSHVSSTQGKFWWKKCKCLFDHIFTWGWERLAQHRSNPFALVPGSQIATTWMVDPRSILRRPASASKQRRTRHTCTPFLQMINFTFPSKKCWQFLVQKTNLNWVTEPSSKNASKIRNKPRLSRIQKSKYTNLT